MTRFNGRHVLVVDDEDDLREIIMEEFQMEGATVEQARNGVDAFKILETGSFDLVVSDVRMPGGGGDELLDRIQKSKKVRPPVILLSGFSDMSVEEAKKRGAKAVLPKPCQLSDLTNLADKIINKV